MNVNFLKLLAVGTASFVSFGFQVATSQAALVSEFVGNGWTTIAAEDSVGNGGYVNPGWGGQTFDAEYLLYKRDGNLLSLGLQTGFNLSTGKVTSGGVDYWAGDLAISFNGSTAGLSSTYEYAVDFGLLSKDYQQDSFGTHAAGLYKVTEWNANSDIYFQASNPFAMKTGNIVDGALIASNLGTGGDSYFRIVQLDLSKILGVDWAKNGLVLDTTWTMSCGNDAINGNLTIAPAPVPEPAILLLLGTGVAGLLANGRRRKEQ